VDVIQDDASQAVVAVRLDNGAKTTLLGAEQMSWNIHVSCRNTRRPGWAYISEFAGTPTSPKADNQGVFAVKIDGSRTVNRFAHAHHSLVEAYERAPMAVPNPDGTRVMWASDWDSGTAPVYGYVATQSP
jgi:hypothetical protein